MRNSAWILSGFLFGAVLPPADFIVGKRVKAGQMPPDTELSSEEREMVAGCLAAEYYGPRGLLARHLGRVESGAKEIGRAIVWGRESSPH